MLKHIYDKTDKGREEIATRKYHVPAKLRSLLVMIDGHRSLETLMKNFGPLGLNEEHVIELFNEQYIALIDDGEPEAAPDAPAVQRAPVLSARARAVMRRDASARAHHENHDQGPATLAGFGDTIAAPDNGLSDSERHIALHEFYTQTIKSTLGLRGMMLQLKVEKCSNIDDFRLLRDVYLEAVLKAKGREMALSLSGRLDQLLSGEPIHEGPISILTATR